MTMQGVVLEVSIRPIQVALEEDTLQGASSLVFTHVINLPPAGFLQIKDTDTVLEYSALDTTTMTATLVTPTDADLLEGAILVLLPRVIEKWAMVEVQEHDDAIFALVPHDLWDRVPEGVREPEDQELVVIEHQAGDWVLADVLGSEPLTDGSFINPDSLPPAPVPAEVGQIADTVAQLVTDVSTNTENITTTADALAVAAEVAVDAGTLASIANVSTTLSDFPPAPSDREYTDADGVTQERRNGSLWMARTRTRINHVTNPSFELNTTGWATTELSTLRELSAVVISGSYSCKLTNSGVAANHQMTWDGGGAAGRPTAVEGQSWAASLYAAAVSGVNIGVYVELLWYNAGGSLISSSPGTPLTLLVDDMQQLEAVAVAPALTATVGLRITNPTGSETSVWRIDGAMLEQDNITGEYFDGRSYDGSWDPITAPDATISKLAGGRIVGVWELDDGGWVSKQFSGTVLADIDASDINRGVLDGGLLGDDSVPQDKLSGTPCTASEALLAGDLVNVFNSGGTFRMQKADADSLKPAHGFVLADTAADVIGRYYTSGYNPFMTGLSPGVQFLSTTPGKCGSSPPSAIGTIHQRVGVAGAQVILNFTYTAPIKLT